MNPLLLKALMENLGMTTPEAQSIALGDFLTSTVNAGTFNQLPRIAAAGSAALTGEDYNQALERAYAGRQAIRERSPLASGAGDIIGGLVNPLDKLNKLGSLARIGSAAGQTALYQTGEQGTSLQDAASAGLLGGGTTAVFEAIPLIGKPIRKLQETFQESGLGLRGAAMKKAGSKVKDKTLLGEGYDLVRDLLKKGDGPQGAIEQAQKVMTGSANRAGSYVEVADAKIKELVKKQEDIALDVSNKLFKKTKVGNQAIMLPKSKVPAIEFDLNQAKNYMAAGDTGRLTSAVGGDIGTFKQNYEELVKDIINPIQQAKAAGTKPAVNLEDLMVLRRKLSGKYNQYAQQGKAEVYTAVVDDLNRAITNNLKNYEKAGVLKVGTSDEFRQAGKDMQKLITFNDAVTLSAASKGNLALPGDLAKAVTSGGGLSMAAYFAGASNPLVATAIGSFGSMPSVQGALGQGIEKGINLAEDVGGMSRPFIDSAIKTGIPLEGEAPEPNMSMPQQTGSADSLSSRLMAEFGDIPSQPSVTPSQAPQSLSERLLAEFGQAPQSVDSGTSSLANGDLPSQQPSLKQGVSLSPDSLGSLADFYPALAMTESSLNPMARNPESSAKGLFQFVDKTAQGVGLQDPFDPRQSLAAVQSLTQENVNRFGVQDPVELYKMHYLGAPTYEAYRNNQPLNKQWQIDAVNSLPTVTSRFQNNLAAVQQPDSPIRQQFMELFS